MVTLVSVTVALALVTENGAITDADAFKILVTSDVATWLYCEVISATVLETSVTWRSALIASVTWMLPKYMVIISGSRSANSTIEEPLRSRTKRGDHARAGWGHIISFPACRVRCGRR